MFAATVESLRQIGWFGTIGAAATALHYIVLVSLVELMGVGPTAASSTGYVAGGALNYILNKRYTFRSAARAQRAVPRFVAVALVGAAANATVVWALTALGGVQYALAQVAATGSVLVWNFLANKYWTFSGGDRSACRDDEHDSSSGLNRGLIVPPGRAVECRSR